MVAKKIILKNLSHIFEQFLKLSGNRQFILKEGQKLTATLASENDIDEVTSLIHQAFAIWKNEGLELGPMHQTVEQTRGHLVGKGIVFRNEAKKIVGTVSFDFATIETISDQHIFCVDNENPILYQKLSDIKFANDKFLVVKRIAALPGIGRSGLGKSILRFAESLAGTLKLNGVVLETVKEAQWLYEWYQKEKYETVGVYHYPNRPIKTLLMYKSL